VAIPFPDFPRSSIPSLATKFDHLRGQKGLKQKMTKPKKKTKKRMSGKRKRWTAWSSSLGSVCLPNLIRCQDTLHVQLNSFEISLGHAVQSPFLNQLTDIHDGFHLIPDRSADSHRPGRIATCVLRNCVCALNCARAHLAKRGIRFRRERGT